LRVVDVFIILPKVRNWASNEIIVPMINQFPFYLDLLYDLFSRCEFWHHGFLPPPKRWELTNSWSLRPCGEGIKTGSRKQTLSVQSKVPYNSSL
jgi:hypothetical protein